MAGCAVGDVLSQSSVPFLFRAMAPKLTEEDRRVVESVSKLINFLVNDMPDKSNGAASGSASGGGGGWGEIVRSASRPETRDRLTRLLPTLVEFAPSMRRCVRMYVCVWVSACLHPLPFRSHPLLKVTVHS